IIELCRVGPFDSTDVASEFNRGALHSKADAEIGSLLATSVVDGAEHAGDSSFPESTGNKYRVHVSQPVLPVGVFGHVFGFNPSNLQSEAVGYSSVNERFVQALVGVLQLHILSYDSDGHNAVRVLDSLNKLRPFANVAFARLEPQLFHDHVIEPLTSEH